MQPVTIVSSQLLRPSSPCLTSGRFELTGLDRIMQFVPYQKRIIFYESRHGSNQEEHDLDSALVLLKTSLEQVLVSFYPLGGRMRSGNGASEPALELDLSVDLSVKFIEAVTSSRLSELGDFRPCEFCELLCDMGCSPQYPWTPEWPLAFIQVTRFGCGGLSIGVSVSHQIVDGVSFWNFMDSWAKVARTGSRAGIPQPVFGYEQRIDSTGELHLEVPPKSSDSSERSPELRMKHYKMDRDTINKLKLETGSRFTTFEVVCAYFWRKVAEAKGFTASTGCNFMVLVNCRGRIKSLQSENYFGNAIWSTVASSSAGDLAGNSVSYAADLLHNSISSFNVGKAEEIYLQRRRQAPRTGPGTGSPSRDFTMIAVESPRQPVYDCDFGFGKPIGMSFGTNDLHDGQLYLFPLPPGGSGSGVSVTVVLDTESLERMH